jgi:ATP-binding protein involved in chromosome partitioning
MFQQLGAPILGIVENMSYFVSPSGEENDIFGRGGAQRAAQTLGLPFLGELPMFTELRVNSDAGDPTANFTATRNCAQSLEQIVTHLAGEVSKRNLATPAPTLNIT